MNRLSIFGLVLILLGSVGSVTFQYRFHSADVKKLPTGKGYPILNMTKMTIWNDTTRLPSFLFTLENNNNTPIRGLHLEAFDYEIFSSFTHSTSPWKKIRHVDYLLSRMFQMNLDSLGPNCSSSSHYARKFGDSRYFIKISTIDRKVIQKIAIITKNDVPYSGIQIMDFRGVLLEEYFIMKSPEPPNIKCELREKLKSIDVKNQVAITI